MVMSQDSGFPKRTSFKIKLKDILGGSVVKNPSASAGDMSSVPESRRSVGEGNDYPLQHSCLGNPMDRGAWSATVQESDTTS